MIQHIELLCIRPLQTMVGQYTDILGIPQYYFDTDYNFVNTKKPYLGNI